MKVVISLKARNAIDDFYHEALKRHEALDEVTVTKKVRRLYAGIRQLKSFYSIYPKARYIEEWIQKGYHDFKIEDFHIAYQLRKLQSGETIVYVTDACHSLLYHSEQPHNLKT